MPTFTNWNGQVSYGVDDADFKMPETIEDVQAIVKAAYETNQKVTVIGAMHSTTECMVGTGVIISMKNMARVLSVDDENLTVTVQAAVTLHQLAGHLKELGLQPPVILEYGNFEIGAISGTHANDTSMRQSGQFSSYVSGVMLVTPTGEIMQISETKNTEYLPAIRSHFGLFGVVCEVTVRIFKTQPLQVDFQVMDINSFLDHFTDELKSLKEAYDQVFAVVFPNTGQLLLQRRKFLDPTVKRPAKLETLLDPVESRNISLFGGLFLPLVKAGTALDPSAPFAALLSNATIDLPLKILAHVTYVIDPCQRAILYKEDEPDFEFYDWVFAEDNWVNALRAFLALTDNFLREKDFFMPLPSVVYFIKQDQESLLSRSRNANMMAIDPLYPDPKEPLWREFRLEFNKMAMEHGGIPHVNKTRLGGIYHFAESHDQEIIKKYLQLRRQLDPKDLFLNPYFQTMFKNYL
jgi:L-gulonolactone oxidase